MPYSMLIIISNVRRWVGKVSWIFCKWNRLTRWSFYVIYLLFFVLKLRTHRIRRWNNPIKIKFHWKFFDAFQTIRNICGWCDVIMVSDASVRGGHFTSLCYSTKQPHLLDAFQLWYFSLRCHIYVEINCAY